MRRTSREAPQVERPTEELLADMVDRHPLILRSRAMDKRRKAMASPRSSTGSHQRSSTDNSLNGMSWLAVNNHPLEGIGHLKGLLRKGLIRVRPVGTLHSQDRGPLSKVGSMGRLHHLLDTRDDCTTSF